MSRAHLTFVSAAFVSFASLAGCASTSPGETGTYDLHGRAISTAIGATRRSGSSIETWVIAGSEAFTVSADGARVTVARRDGAQTFSMALEGAQLEAFGVDDGAGESYEGSLPRAGEAPDADTLASDLLVAAESGALSSVDRNRLNIVLPLALSVTATWSRQGLGLTADRAADTARAYAAAVMVQVAPGEGVGQAQQALDAETNGNTSCSYNGPHCSCSVCCSGNTKASCTACNACVCVIGPTGLGGRPGAG